MLKRKWVKMILSITIIAIVFILPMNAFAWKPAAHYTIAQKVAQNLADSNAIKQSMQAYPGITAWGASGPDVPYASLRELFGYAPYADAFHAHKEGYISSQLLQLSIASNDQQQIAFAGGWLTHVIGDMECHGLLTAPDMFSGSDNNIYFGVKFADNTVKEWLFDKTGYNDFEMGDNDYYFPYISESNLTPQNVREVYFRATEYSWWDDDAWKLESFKVYVDGNVELDNTANVWLEDGDKYTVGTPDGL